MEQNPTTQIADVILKIKDYQDLTAAEELLYLIHIEKVPEEEAKRLIFKWYDHEGQPIETPTKNK